MIIHSRYRALRIKLDEVVKDSDFEKLVLENLSRCHRLSEGKFKIIFWNKNISEKDVKAFINRNEELLFKFQTKITKKFDRTWFLIDSTGEDESKYSFKYTGEILQGIAKYIELILKVRKNDYDDNRR